jgi:hypothetical protein
VKIQGQIKPFESPDAEMTKGLEIPAERSRETPLNTEIMDLLFLELSQFTTARTHREISMQEQLDRQAEQLEAKDKVIERLAECGCVVRALRDSYPKLEFTRQQLDSYVQRMEQALKGGE